MAATEPSGMLGQDEWVDAAEEVKRGRLRPGLSGFCAK